MAKRILTLVLALLMLACFFTGCTGGGQTATTAATTTAAAANTVASTTAGTTTTAAVTAPTTTAAVTAPTTAAATGNPVFSETGYPIMSEMIDVTCTTAIDKMYLGEDVDETAYWKRLREATNIHISWNILEPEAEKVNLYFAAGEFSDFFLGNLSQDRIQTYGIDGGVFVDISDMIDKYMPNMVSRYAEWPTMEKVIRQLDGSIYTIPQVRLGSTAANGQIFYRTDLLDSIGIETPTTTTEFYDALVACRDADVTGGYAPFLPYSKDQLNSQCELFFFAAMGDSVDPGFADDGSGKVVYNYIGDQYYRYLEYMARLYKEKLLENEIYSMDTDTVLARWKSGQAVFMNAASNIQPEDCLPNGGKVYLDCLAPLTSDNNSVQHVASYPYLSTSTGGFNVDCKYVPAILRMLDAAYADVEIIPGTGLIDIAANSGFEGEQYIVHEDNTYEHIVPDGWTDSTWTYLRKYGGWNVQYGIYDAMYLNAAPNNFARESGMVKNNIPYAVDRFPDALMKYTSDEAVEIANKLTDINNYMDQMRAKFITGVEPLTNWESYVKEIQKMGIDDVLAIKQTAYDRWNAD